MRMYAITENDEVIGHLVCDERELASLVMPEGHQLVDDAALVAISVERSKAAKARAIEQTAILPIQV